MECCARRCSVVPGHEDVRRSRVNAAFPNRPRTVLSSAVRERQDVKGRNHRGLSCLAKLSTKGVKSSK